MAILHVPSSDHPSIHLQFSAEDAIQYTDAQNTGGGRPPAVFSVFGPRLYFCFLAQAKFDLH